MGVTEILHFRRILRRGRQVADGNRQYVIGSDKSGEQSPQSLPKGSHFTVVYDRCSLNPGEEDACNNNSSHGSDGVITVTSSSTTFPTVTTCTENASQSSVVVAMVPASSQTYTHSNGHSPVAVVTTTELQEVQFFAQVENEISTRTN